MARCVNHKKYNFPLSNFHLLINFSQNWCHNIYSHPCFRIWVVINAMGSGETLNVLKQCGFLLLTTSGPIAFSRAAFTKNTMVSLVFDFLPPLAWLFFSARPFCGSALKKNSLFSRYSRYQRVHSLSLTPLVFPSKFQPCIQPPLLRHCLLFFFVRHMKCSTSLVNR